MAGAVAVQVSREDVFESCHRGGDITAPQEATSCQQNQVESMVEVRTPCAVEARDGANSAGDGGDDRPEMEGTSNGDGSTLVGDGERASSPTVDRRSRLAPYKPGKMTVVLDMDECLLHSKFHGPGAASEAYRQSEERPDAVNEVNSFWVALEDGDTAQVNKRPGLDPFLEALARDYNTIVFTAAMPDYAGPVLDYIDPKGTLFHRRLYRSSCRQVKGAFLKDLSVLGLENTDMTRTVLVDNNPLSFICQPTNGVLVASFYDDPTDTALASVMQLIRYLDHAGDVRPILKEMFRLDTLLAEYRNALFDEDEPSGNEAASAADCTSVAEENTGGIAGVDEENLLSNNAGNNHAEGREAAEEMTESARENVCPLEVGDGQVDIPEVLKDDDDESVETEPCSDESGESSLGEESLASREEMELDLEF